MKTKFNGILTLLLAFMVQFTFAQERMISGVVSDDVGPVSDISVLVKGTTNGTVTDFDGNYTINAKTGDVLVFSHISYDDQEKIVGESNTINLTLTSSGESIDEVVIKTGYDITKTKPRIASSIVTISSETIENRPNASAIQTLQGQSAGLSIITANGQPGAASNVAIRGYGSVNGKTEPLVIIDGIVVDIDQFKNINPNEFSSVSVLKDAGATAIYGNRGSNGAIIITTKSGKYNSPLTVNYSFSSSFSTLQGNKYDLKDSSEQLHLEKLYGAGLGSGLTDAEIAAISKYANTNWQDVFFRSAFTQNHNLTLKSGGEKTNNFTSLSYMDQEGILKDSDLKRFNIRSNFNGKSSNEKFDYGTSLSISYSKSNTPNSIGSSAINRNYVLGAFMSVPYVSPYDYTPGDGGNIPVQFYLTPLFLLDRLDTYTRFQEETRIMGGINASYKIAKDLTLRTRLSSDFRETHLTRAESPISFNAQLFAQTGNTTPGFQSQQSTRNVNFNLVNSLTYSKTFNEVHNFTVAGYTEYYKAHYRDFGYFAEGLNPQTFYPGDGSGLVDDNASNDYFVDQANAQILNSGLFSYFGTLNYDYGNKYGVDFTVRRDASYRFRETNRWGTFWSVAGRWNINKEEFMKDKNFNLKLRASYGETGNQYLGGNSDFNASSLDLDLYATSSGYQGQNSLLAVQIGNLNLGWETTKQANIGLDFRILNKKLDGSIDVYHKKTVDLFEDLITNSTSGEISQRVNGGGSIVNKGIELSFSYDLLTNKNGLNAKLRFAGDYNDNARFLEDGQTIPGVEDGGKLFQYYDYRYAGVNPENGNLLYYTADGNLTESPNEDTDRVFLGLNSIPDYQGSFGINLDYNGFYLDTQFNFVVGVDRYDNDYDDVMDATSIGQFRHSNDIDRAWTLTNRYTDVPSLTATNLSLRGTRYLQSADYLRLRFVNFGYSVPKKYIDNYDINSLKVFVNGENLHTFTGWRGYDAEGFNTGRSYPTPKTISLGLEINF